MTLAPSVDEPAAGGSGARAAKPPRDWAAIRTLMQKDITAVRRSKSITIPMIAVPIVLLVLLPIVLGNLSKSVDPGAALSSPLVKGLLGAISDLPPREQLPVLVLQLLLSPLLLVIPLMVSAVLAADAFAGEKERRTLESLLHLPISDRDLFLAKLLGAFVPALVITWAGSLLYGIVANAVAWSATSRLIIPFSQWSLMMIWVAPAVALLAIGLLVLVSSRAKTTQEANQLGGAVILPLILIAAGQAAGFLLTPLPVVFLFGIAVWIVALVIVVWGGRRFTRDRLATAA